VNAGSVFDRLDVAGSGPAGLVAVGADLSVDSLVGAYRNGVFPWPDGESHSQVRRWQLAALVRSGRLVQLPDGEGRRPRSGLDLPWHSPDPRCVLIAADGVHISRSLRAQLRRCGWTTTCDAAFSDVVAGCATAHGPTWITREMAAAYQRLHAVGVAHSVEVWDADDRLVGGVYGVAVGGVFVGESMFSRATGASKVALADVADRLRAAGGVLVDAQLPTEHLLSLGFVPVHRADYLAVLRAVRDVPAPLSTERLPAARLGTRPKA
jgi:leucyl/phenylalanyl-tRNA---protein transferase